MADAVNVLDVLAEFLRCCQEPAPNPDRVTELQGEIFDLVDHMAAEARQRAISRR